MHFLMGGFLIRRHLPTRIHLSTQRSSGMREKREEPITKESERWNMVLLPRYMVFLATGGMSPCIHHHCVQAIGNPSGLQARTELQHGDEVAQMQTVI